MTNQKTPEQGGAFPPFSRATLTSVIAHASVDATLAGLFDEEAANLADAILRAFPELQGGATEEQIEAAALALFTLDNGQDDAFSRGVWKNASDDAPVKRRYRELAVAAVDAAHSAPASAHPADEHHDAEECEAESEDHAATVTGDRVKCPERRDDEHGQGMRCILLEVHTDRAHIFTPDPVTYALPEGLRGAMNYWAENASGPAIRTDCAAARDALAVPVKVDEAKLAEVLHSAMRDNAMLFDNGTEEWIAESDPVECLPELAHSLVERREEWMRGEGR